MISPNYDKAATQATETLITWGIRKTPVDPLPILKSLDSVNLCSFMEMSEKAGCNRDDVLSAFGNTKDAVTSAVMVNGEPEYFIAYNQLLPFYAVQHALARELGHIVLGHDGTLPADVRTAEARCFANHLLCPRPLIRAVQDMGMTDACLTWQNSRMSASRQR